MFVREDLGKFKYLVQCLKESLRISPPVPFIQRVIQNDVVIDGKVLPAGTTVDVSVYNLHHNPEIWPDHMVGNQGNQILSAQDSFSSINSSVVP